MKTILIDDEPLALAYLEKLLEGIPGITIVGKYSNPRKALESLKMVTPNLVFLDIEMPETNGIELAEYIQEELSDVKIVFITAYDAFAVKAFELNAVDYIMKPVKRDRLIETIRRLPNIETKITEQSDSIMVCCFQQLSFCMNRDDELQPLDVHWRTFKARELFAFLIQHRNQPIRKDIILDLFWPEMDWKKGFSQLYATIYQIRKTLRTLNINITISSVENSYKLTLNEVLLDVDVWENELNELPTISNVTLPKYQKLIDLYIGDYLALDDYIWAEGERERLRGMWLQLMKKVTDYLVFRGNYSGAISLYHRIQALHPYYEDSYLMLMILYESLGDRPSIEQQYSNYSKMFMNEYGLKPTGKIKDWYDKWKMENK